MRWALDDNERSAFHYLLGGAAVVLTLKLIAFGIDTFSAPALPEEEARVLLSFRHGYLLSEPMAVVGTAADRMERIMLAIVTSVTGALALAGVAALLAWALGRSPRRAAVITTRAALFLLLGWCLYAVLFLPLHETSVREGVLLLRERKALVGDIPLPFSLKEEPVAHPGIDRVEAVRTPCDRGCDGSVEILLTRKNGRQTVLARQASICPPAELERLKGASEAATLLEREVHG